MPKKFKITDIHIKIVLLILLSIISIELTIYSQNLVENEPKTPKTKIWSEEIRKFGGEKAFLDFKEAVTPLDPGVQHTQAHIFGEALFNEFGIDGVSICDNSFAFGCYHSFLGTAIKAKGLNIVPLLNEKCIEKLKTQALGCQHGIGHGIMADLGYKFKDLSSALENCDKLPVNDPIGGCKGGVFMEYNFQTMLSKDAKIRNYDINNPNYPCQDVRKEHRPACYYWQAQWWNTVFSGNNPEKYTQIGLLCQKLTIAEEKEQCFLGTGNITGPIANWDVDEAINLCDTMPSHEGMVLCRAHAANSFFAEPKSRNIASKICEGLGVEEAKCISKSGIKK